MSTWKWSSCAFVTVGLFLACGGNSGGNGSNPGDGDGDGDGDLVEPGESGGSGSGDGDDSVDERYGDAYGSLVEVCDILVWAQIKRSNECTGLPPSESPSPYPLCPDVLFAPGSTRPTTIDGAWECAAEWEAMSCDDLRSGLLPTCFSRGTVAAGSPCVTSPQCASGECSLGNLQGCGVCLEEGDGIACDMGTACLGLTYCDGAECVSQIPDTSMPPPEPVRAGEGEACMGLCEVGLVCAFSEVEDGRVCRPELAAGQTCYQRTVTVEVERAFVCTASEEEVFCNASQMCQVAGAIGSPCPRDADAVVHCVEGAGCDADGTCQFPGGPGTPCLEASYFERCGEDEVCVDEVCKLPLGYGEDCSNDSATLCAESANCEGGVCVPDDTLDAMSELCSM